MEKKYPEATEKKDYYGGIYNQLNTLSGLIKSSLANANTYIIENTLMESAELEGEYYEIYLSKKNEFVEETMIYWEKLNTFRDELQVCLSKAKELHDLWEARENIYE